MPWGEWWWVLVQKCARLRPKTKALSGAAKPGALWLISLEPKLRPALPSALAKAHRGRVTWALWRDQKRAAA